MPRQRLNAVVGKLADLTCIFNLQIQDSTQSRFYNVSRVIPVFGALRINGRIGEIDPDPEGRFGSSDLRIFMCFHIWRQCISPLHSLMSL